MCEVSSHKAHTQLTQEKSSLDWFYNSPVVLKNSEKNVYRTWVVGSGVRDSVSGRFGLFCVVYFLGEDTSYRAHTRKNTTGSVLRLSRSVKKKQKSAFPEPRFPVRAPGVRFPGVWSHFPTRSFCVRIPHKGLTHKHCRQTQHYPRSGFRKPVRSKEKTFFHSTAYWFAFARCASRLLVAFS